MLRLALLALCACALVHTRLAAAAGTVGDQLHSTFPDFDAQPTTTDEALAAGYKSVTGVCDAQLGIAYTMGGDEPSKDNPLTFFYTPAGQLAGLGVTIFGSDVPQNLVDGGYWMPVAGAKDTYFASVTFRAPSDVCSSATSDEVVGTQIVLNQGTLDFDIPTTEQGAKDALFDEGSCVDKMGRHYNFDVEVAPAMSWEAANLLPITPMYWTSPETGESVIYALFFSSADAQRFLGSSPWEFTLPSDSFMCYNWCEDDCTWTDNTTWSTMHFFFRDYNEVQCTCMTDPSMLACCE